MVKATRKPLEEIFETVRGYRRVLTVGCGGCASVCLAGGQRESLELNDDLAECARREKAPLRLDCFVTERQCNPEFLDDIADLVKGADCLLSTACGVGAQAMADAFPATPVFPAMDTLFVGTDRDVGLYRESCRTCGRCLLAYTGGICPVTRCSKSLFNGPCGGTRADGGCEVGDGVPCAWKDIHDRLSAQGRLQSILEIHPTVRWIDKGPATLIQRGFEGRYAAGAQEGARG